MAYSITKSKDGDISLGNLRAELVILQPVASDYAAGGYLVQGIGGATQNSGNVGIGKVLFVIPISIGGGYSLNWNPATSKIQVFQTAAIAGTPAAAAPESEVAAGTNLAAFPMMLLVVGL